MNFFKKIIFSWRKPKLIIITGNGRSAACRAVFQVLKPHFKVGKEIFIFESDLTNSARAEKFKFFVKNSSLPILVATHVGDIPPDKDFFAGEKEKTEKTRKLAKTLPTQGYLILNFDDETVREIADITNLKTLTFGFQKEADFQASDINANGGTNFKMNYKGNIVPFWLDGILGKEQIYAVLAASVVATLFDLNLVEISQAFKDYRPSH